MTPEEERIAAKLNEIVHDESLFVQNFFTIKNEDGKIVPFVYNPVQKAYERKRTRFDFVLKARKLGMSSYIIAGDLWACATKRHEHAVCLTHTGDAAGILMAEKVKPLLENSDFPIKVKMLKDYLYFPQTESRYYIGTAGSKRFGRGDDITRFHATEFAHWDDPTVLTAIEEACTAAAIGRIETTANGVNFAKKLWDKCKSGESRYQAVFFPWYVNPRYQIKGASLSILSENERELMDAFGMTIAQLAWRREKLKAMSQPEFFPQEYPASDDEAFLSSGRMVFDWISLLRHEKHVSPPKWRGHLRDLKERVDIVLDDNAPLRIWKPPIPGHKYFIGADVAEGIEDGAYSVGQVLDIGESEVVACYHNHIAPDRFGGILEMLGRYYNIARISPEAWPGPGGTTMAELMRLNYPMLHVLPDEKEPGWFTTAKSKPIMIFNLCAAIRELRITLHDHDTIEELRSYVYNPRGGMDPGLGCFSDRLMALAIAWHCSRELYETSQYSNIRVSSLASEHVSFSNLTTTPKYEGRIMGRHAD